MILGHICEASAPTNVRQSFSRPRIPANCPCFIPLYRSSSGTMFTIRGDRQVEEGSVLHDDGYNTAMWGGGNVIVYVSPEDCLAALPIPPRRPKGRKAVVVRVRVVGKPLYFDGRSGYSAHSVVIGLSVQAEPLVRSYDLLAEMTSVGVPCSADNNFLMRWLVRRRRVAEAIALASTGIVDPSDCGDEAMCTAAHNGDAGIIRALLKDARVNPNARMDLPIRSAMRHGHMLAIRELLSDARVNPFRHFADPLSGIAETRRGRLWDGVLRLAASAGRDDIAVRIISESRASVHAKEAALCMACAQGRMMLVRTLLADKRIDPNCRSGMALHQAVMWDRTSVMAALLQDPRTDPECRKYTGWNYRIASGSVKLVRRSPSKSAKTLAVRARAVLWRYQSVNGSSEIDTTRTLDVEITEKEAAEYALFPNGRKLGAHGTSGGGGGGGISGSGGGGGGGVGAGRGRGCGDKRSIGNRDADGALVRAATAGHWMALRECLLINGGRMSPVIQRALVSACRHGHSHCTALLLTHPYVNPNADDDAAMSAACDGNHGRVVEALLAHPAFVCSDAITTIFYRAVAAARLDTVRAFALDPRFMTKAIVKHGISLASAMNHPKIRAFLAEHRDLTP